MVCSQLRLVADTPPDFLIGSPYIADFVRALDAKSRYFPSPSLIISNLDRGRKFRAWEIDSTL